MDKVIYKDERFLIKLIREEQEELFSKVIVEDREYSTLAEYDINRKAGTNALMELLSKIDSLDEIVALNLKLDREVSENTYLKGNVIFGGNSYTRIDEVATTLAGWSYYNSYGLQELFGSVLLKNNCWLERYEYDGSEGWNYMKYPTVKEIINGKLNSNNYNRI